MTTPRLTEVFLIPEASVQSLAQRYRVPVALAHWTNEHDRQNADAILAIWTARKRQSGAEPVWDDASSGKRLETAMTIWGDMLSDYLKRFPAKKREMVALAASNWQAFLKVLKDHREDQYTTGNTIMELPDGHRWVKLEDGQCDREGEMMQHCGRPLGDGNPMYSLRDQNGKPHVTAEVGESGIGPWSMLMQCKGKQNRAPDRKYWPAVLALCKKFNVRFNDEDGRPSGAAPGVGGIGFDGTEDELFDWLDERL